MVLFNVIAINDAKEFCLGCFILSLIMTLSFTKKESEWVSGIGVLITMQTYPKLGEGEQNYPKPSAPYPVSNQLENPTHFWVFSTSNLPEPKNPLPQFKVWLQLLFRGSFRLQTSSQFQGMSPRVEYRFVFSCCLSLLTYISLVPQCFTYLLLAGSCDYIVVNEK